MARSEKRTLNIRALLTDELTKEMSGIRKSIDKTAKATKKANKASAKSFSKVKKAVVALAVAYISLRSVAIVKNLAASTDAMGKLAIATGETVENVSELSAAFGFAGGSSDQFRAVLTALLSAQRAGVKGTGEQTAIFEQMGISMLELERASPIELFRKLADGSERFADATERQLKFSTLFPEQWKNVINLVQGGADAFDARLEEARKAGATVTAEQAKSAALITDAFFRVELAVQSVGREMLVAFGPGLIGTLEALAEVFNTNRGLIVDLAKTIKSLFVGAIDAMAQGVIGLISLVEQIPGVKLGSKAAPGTDAFDTVLKFQIESLRNTIKGYETLGLTRAFDDQQQLNVFAALEAEIVRLQRERVRLGFTGSLADQLQLLKDDFGKTISALGDEIGAAAARNAGKKTGKAFVEGFKEQAEVDLPVASQGFAAAVANAIAQALALIDKVKESSAQAANTFEAGWTRSIAGVVDQLDNMNRTVGEGSARVVTQSLNNLSNEIAGVITGAKTAKEAWKSFINSTLTLLAQLIAKLAVLKVAQIVTGRNVQMAKGGVLPGVSHDTASLPVREYAHGGIARRPQLAVFGEGNRAEAFVPLPDNRSIPVSFTGGGGPSSGAGTVNVNIYAWDSRDVARGLVENQETLRGIFQVQAETRNSVRQTLQRASR